MLTVVNDKRINWVSGRIDNRTGTRDWDNVEGGFNGKAVIS